MAEVELVSKDGRNQSQKYNYISHENAIKAIRKSMLKHGVVYFSHLEETTHIEKKTNSGSIMLIAQSTFKHVFINAEKPTEKIEFNNVGWGSDSLDKAIYKANTGAKKYALFTLFQLVDGIDGQLSDPENDNCKTNEPKNQNNNQRNNQQRNNQNQQRNNQGQQQNQQQNKQPEKTTTAFCKLCKSPLKYSKKGKWFCPNFQDENKGIHTIIPDTHIKRFEEYQQLLAKAYKLDKVATAEIENNKKQNMDSKIPQLKAMISFLNE